MKKTFCLLVFSPLFLFCQPCLAEDKNNGRVVRVGVFQMEPINFMDEKGRAKGSYPELITRIAKHENWQVTLCRR